MNENLRASPTCRAAIQLLEGFTAKATPDCNGLAIGFGHHGPEVHAGLVWTREQALTAHAGDVAAAEAVVRRYAKVSLNQGQFDALVDWVYQFGAGHLQSASFLKALNAGDYKAVPYAFYHQDAEGNSHGWIYVNGKISTGLINRRKQDISWWNKGA